MLLLRRRVALPTAWRVFDHACLRVDGTEMSQSVAFLCQVRLGLEGYKMG